MRSAYLAIDLGAESGRVMAGVLDQGQVALHEMHRFLHSPQELPSGLHWNLSQLWQEILTGLKKSADWARENAITIRSIGVDTWGVDWALLDGAGELMGLPHAYRDPRNPPVAEQVVARLGRSRIFATTGTQFMPINTLYSVAAHHQASHEMLAAARRFLFIPDLLHYWLSGVPAIEATIASTSQMVNCHTGDWAHDLLEELGLPSAIFGKIFPPGTRLGPLRANVASVTGLPADVQVVLPGSHDTASAVAAVPAERGTSWCYLSSGTWSLLGAELAAPCTSEAALAAGYSNELGVEGRIRLLTNIAGLWLVQQCRADLKLQGHDLGYEQLVEQAAAAPGLVTLIDPGDPSFATSGQMLGKLAALASRTGQPVPSSPGSAVRTCLESLALCYRDRLQTLETLLGQRFDLIHIVGGGGKNQLLSQMTADATQRTVVVGPYEATALGNALTQAMAMGAIRDLDALRETVAASIAPIRYTPQNTPQWQQAQERYSQLVRRS